MTYLFIICVFLICLCSYTLLNCFLLYKHFRKDLHDFYEYSMSVEKCIRKLKDDAFNTYQLTLDKFNTIDNEKV